MVITRQIKGEIVEIELTSDEVSQAYDEHVISFMQGVFMEDFGIEDEDEARGLAECSFEKYCEGNGLTEYECIEKVYDEIFEREECAV